ncbi:MAG: bifunctional indole-3-glycerol phosphate synthase/phosphoribosylanthranilate isomerase [Planctomycetaceae bacterium]|nr:bifunctional indole-3-glycerol phosphate synthase/phosphoribosylanthranilate isomerase [Planctomycetaceae bacterium]
MTDILNQIVARRLKDIESKTVSVAELKARHNDRTDFRPFHQSLKRNMVRPGRAAIIAEIKRGSPAKGLFAPDLGPVECAKTYERGGAACLSVLTEPHWFFGAMDDLVAARNACELPVLQKDFVVTEYQVYEAAVHADCMLLIARCLEQQQLADLYGLATELGLDVLVEVFDEEDIDKIEPFHFPLIGINHRNLRTMGIDLERSRQLVSRFAPDQTVVAASGIKSRDDIVTLMQTGIRAFLVGESLSRLGKGTSEYDKFLFLNNLVSGEGFVLIKICGITTPEMAVACLEAGANFIGLVHYPPSPRHVDTSRIREILDAVTSFWRSSGAILVAVDQLPGEIDPRFSGVQIYKDFQPCDFERDLRSLIKIRGVNDYETFNRLLEPSAILGQGMRNFRYLLELSSGKLPGGNGAAWDWSLARPFCERYPTLLAGGITPENVAEAIRLARPCGIDVSSGVESSPGVKDISKVKQLIENVHQAIIFGDKNHENHTTQ